MRTKIPKPPKQVRGFLSDFKAFAVKGNVIDLAVGVIIGGAFGKITSSLVSDVVMPLIGVIIGGIDFKSLALDLPGDAKLQIGMFLQSVTDFLIISLSVFVFIKLLSKLKKKEEEPPPAEPSEEVLLLREIVRQLTINNEQ